MQVKLGLYRHYKGNIYRVFAVGVKEDTLKLCVVYCNDTDGPVWIRDITDFQEEIKPGVPRFSFLYQVDSPFARDLKIGNLNIKAPE